MAKSYKGLLECKSHHSHWVLESNRECQYGTTGATTSQNHPPSETDWPLNGLSIAKDSDVLEPIVDTRRLFSSSLLRRPFCCRDGINSLPAQPQSGRLYGEVGKSQPASIHIWCKSNDISASHLTKASKRPVRFGGHHGNYGAHF